MDDELSPAAPADRSVEQGQMPANAIIFERSTQQPSVERAGQRDAAEPERRVGISDLERAAIALAHAVQYLSSEQRAGRCTSVPSNRQAITILCECAEGLTALENREQAREALNTWLAGAKPSA